MNVQILSQYLEFLEIEKGLSANTIDAYKRDLTAFLDFCTEKGAEELCDIERTHINGYILKLHEEKYTSTSVMRKTASLRGFFKWLCANEICNTNPALTLEQPKIPKKLPKVMTIEEINTILSQNLTKLERVILELLYGCGLRVSELCNLKISDLYLDEGFINTTKDPDKYWFEKKISGAYLGPFSAFVIEKAISEGILSAEFEKAYRTIEPLNTTRMSHYLEMCHNSDYDLVRCVGDRESDATALYRILKSIIERAGKLTAINLTAAILKSGKGTEPRYPVVINADGTTFYKTEFLEFYTRLYLDEILEKKHQRYYRIVNIDNSPTLGAAIAGLAI